MTDVLTPPSAPPAPSVDEARAVAEAARLGFRLVGKPTALGRGVMEIDRKSVV